MPIVYHEKSKEFHLYNKEVSYLFQIIDNGQLGQLYYGKRLRDREDFSHLFERCSRDMAPYNFGGNCDFSLEHIKQEYPTFGNGDMRYPAYEIERVNGSRIVEFAYDSHKIYQGKPELSGMPATYVEKPEEAETLEVTLKEPYIHMKMVLIYTIYEDYPVITRSVRFENESEDDQVLLNALSGCVDLPDRDYEMIELAGAWARERNVVKRYLEYGLQGIYSMRGASSYQFNPFLVLKRPKADEFSGEVLGFSLVYSGNFLAQVEVDNYDVSRVLLGIHPHGFRWTLKQGESFQTPEMVMVYSDKGLNKMSQVYHELYRTRLARGKWRDLERPILINNWEATYFDFNEQKIYELAEKAAGLGIELFVLDDGWFGKRNDDTSSLGDWYPNEEKLKGGLRLLAERINGLGLKFGMWIEPEMVNKDSDLYRKHPDWVFAEVGRNMCHSRNQYVLDFSKKEVRDYIYDMLERLFLDLPISYIKWDMNRTLSDIFSNGNDREYQGKTYHKYILGVYELYERLIQKFPDILFESCASGGARFDPGMLYYAPQAWTSDNTDAVQRLKIQYGTSMVYPISSIGSHVSASPNHQTGRETSMEMRADVAYFGTFGYELDLMELTEEDLEKIREQVVFMKEHRSLIHHGTFYRLKSPFEGNETAWMVVAKDRREALVAYYRILQPTNTGFCRLKLEGLDEEVMYQIEDLDYDCYGDELMQSGLILSDTASGVRNSKWKEKGDFQARLIKLTAI